MRRSRFTENQILKILKEVENGRWPKRRDPGGNATVRERAIDHCARVMNIEESRSDGLPLTVCKPEGPNPRYSSHHSRIAKRLRDPASPGLFFPELSAVARAPRSMQPEGLL